VNKSQLVLVAPLGVEEATADDRVVDDLGVGSHVE
jgi:hypothetical protein